jgi:hypothetical protein
MVLFALANTAAACLLATLDRHRVADIVIGAFGRVV